MAEHPIEAHEYLLSDLRSRLNFVEDQVHELIQWKAGSEERLKSISEAIVELKKIMENYTKDVKESLAKIAQEMTQRFETIESEVGELKGRSGRKWDDLVRTIMTVAVGALIGYFMRTIGG